MARLLRVKILEAWKGYNINSTVTMTEPAYYRIKSEGVKLSIVSGQLEPIRYKSDITVDFKNAHDRPFIFDEEE